MGVFLKKFFSNKKYFFVICLLVLFIGFFSINTGKTYALNEDNYLCSIGGNKVNSYASEGVPYACVLSEVEVGYSTDNFPVNYVLDNENDCLNYLSNFKVDYYKVLDGQCIYKATAINSDIVNNYNYKIVYDANGGSGAMASSNHVYGTPKNLFNNTFSYVGHKFVEWNTMPDGSGTTYSDGEIVDILVSDENAVITLYAQWRKNKINIKYNVNDGIIKSNTNNKIGESYSWITNENGIILKATNGSVASDLFNIFEYGGNLELEDYNNSNGMYITREAHSVKEGAEWICLSGDCKVGSVYNQSLMYNSSSICNATMGDCTAVLGVNWENDVVSTYTVVYNPNGGVGVMENSIHVYGIDKSLSENKFVFDGYTFIGWGLESTGVVMYSNGQTVNNIARVGETLNLYAIWVDNENIATIDDDVIPIVYKIKYHANGGVGSMNDSEHVYGISKNLNANVFIREGYEFVGWNTEADGSGEYYSNGQLVDIQVNKNNITIDLYAQWMEIVEEEIPDPPVTGSLSNVVITVIAMFSLLGVIYYYNKLHS